MIEGVGRVSPGSLAWGHSYSVAVRRSILRIAAASPAESRTCKILDADTKGKPVLIS